MSEKEKKPRPIDKAIKSEYRRSEEVNNVLLELKEYENMPSINSTITKCVLEAAKKRGIKLKK
jgi:hypothetical protein